MTPDVVQPAQPLDITNPHVQPGQPEQPAAATTDRATAVESRHEPLVIVNPHVVRNSAVARAGR
jgi:hypothetical protein